MSIQEAIDALTLSVGAEEGDPTLNGTKVGGETESDQDVGGAGEPIQNGTQMGVGVTGGGDGEPSTQASEPMENGAQGTEEELGGIQQVEGSLGVEGGAGQVLDRAVEQVEGGGEELPVVGGEELPVVVGGVEVMVYGEELESMSRAGITSGQSRAENMDFPSAPALHSASGERIVDDADFPFGPPLHSAREEEPDLDDEEELASSNSNPSLLDLSHANDPLPESNRANPNHDLAVSSLPLPQPTLFSELPAGEVVEMSLARSQSKVIPLPTRHHQCHHQPRPVNNTRTPDSTPSSSVGGSLGQPSLGLDVVIPESNSADVSKSPGHASLSRRRSWQSEGTSVDEEDDIVAVPVVVRSISSG